MEYLGKYGTALGNGLTGLHDSPHVQRPAGHDASGQAVPRLAQNNPSLVWVVEPAGRAMPRLVTQFTEYQNVPEYPPYEELDQFTKLDGLRVASDTTTLASPISPRKRHSGLIEDEHVPVAAVAVPKRMKRKPDGYPCTAVGCGKIYDLNCALKKHLKAVHTSGSMPCVHCAKQFHWPKDVRRHLEQVHGIQINTPKVHEHDNQHHGILLDEPGSEAYSTVIPEALVSQHNPSEQQKKKKKMSFSSLQNIVLMLQRLSLSVKDSEDEGDEDGLVMVTHDKSTWREVPLRGAHTAEMLTRNIIGACPGYEGHGADRILLHKHHPDKRGRRLVGPSLMKAVSKARAAKRTLKIVLTPANPRTVH